MVHCTPLQSITNLVGGVDIPRIMDFTSDKDIKKYIEKTTWIS